MSTLEDAGPRRSSVPRPRRTIRWVRGIRDGRIAVTPVCIPCGHRVRTYHNGFAGTVTLCGCLTEPSASAMR